MRYIDFLKLSYKSFMRSPNLSTKIFYKIMAVIGFLFFLLYMLSFVFLAYYGIKEKYPQADVFYKANSYLFVFFFIVIYVLMYLQFDQMQVKYFMLLPVPKRKIITYYLSKILIHPVNLVFLLMILMYVLILYFNGYEPIGLFFWALGVMSMVYLINFLMFFSGKNQFFQAGMSLLFFVLIIKMKWIAEHLSGLGDFFYSLYTRYYVSLILLLILAGTYLLIFRYISKRFYLDDAVKAGKKQVAGKMQLSWIDRFGFTGTLIKNDIRLILRNVRPRQGLIGFVVFYVFAMVLFSDYGGSFQQTQFNKILFLMMLSGYFVMQFGNFIPAWDSEYFPLLMSQGISYRQYLEAKWWLLAVSVLVILVLTLPFLYFGWQVYLLIVALGIFNIGVNIPLVLFSGSFKTSPIKLNMKVKAFQNKENFNFKAMLLGIFRLIGPILIYLLIKKYFGYNYAIGVLLWMGLLGLIFRNYLLDKLSLLYIKRKYQMLAGFKKAESE